jgi:tetratricopeptide (TPR) repeat protein
MEAQPGTRASRPLPGSPIGSAGLILLGALLLFSPLLEGGTTHQAAMVIRLAILMLAGFWLATLVRSGVLLCPPMAVGPAVAAYLGLAALSVAGSAYPNQSRQWLLVLLGYGALLYLLRLALGTWPRLRGLVLVLVAAGTAEAGLALCQWWAGAARPTGTFFNPNFLAGYLAVVACLILGHLCYARWTTVGGRPGRVRLAAAVTVLILLLAALIGTGSRGGALALTIGAGLVLLLRFGRAGLTAVALIVAVGALVPNPVRDRVAAEHRANPEAYTRWALWKTSLAEMRDHPLGIGLGLYQYAYPRYAVPVEGEVARYGKAAATAHNEYLQMGVELGPMSLLLFGWGVLLVAGDARASWRARLRREERGLLGGLVGGATAALAHAAVDSPLHEPAIAIALTLCVAGTLAIGGLRRGALPARVVPVRSRAAWGVVGAAALAVAAVEVIRIGVGWSAYEEGRRASGGSDLPAAIAHFERAAAWDPGKALYRSALGGAAFQLYERTGRSEAAAAAVAALETAAALNPLDGRLPALLGRVQAALAARGGHRGAEHLRAALAAYGRAVELEPFAPHYLFELGRLHAALGDGDAAEAAVRRAVEIEPNFLPAREWLAWRYLDSGRLGAASREYREIVERQQRFADRTKTPLEERFLSANARALGAELDRAGART